MPDLLTPADQMKDYNVQIKVRNNCLLKAMRFNGIYTASELHRRTGVSENLIGEYLNLKRPVKGKDGRWKPSFLKLANFLKFLPEDIIPPQHINDPLQKNTVEIELCGDDMKMLVLAGSYESEEDRYLEEETGGLKAALEKALGSLSTREEEIITKRFGLFGGEPMMIDEIKEIYSLSSARIRQIEMKALSKLRRPNRAKHLKEYWKL